MSCVQFSIRDWGRIFYKSKPKNLHFDRQSSELTVRETEEGDIFTWSLRTSSVLICCTYLVFHSAFLVINFLLLSNTDSHLANLATVTDNAKILDTNLQPSQINVQVDSLFFF